MYAHYPATRLRRNRKATWSRKLIREVNVTASDLIMPIFLQEGEEGQEIASMPGLKRYSIKESIEVCKEAFNSGVPAIMLFPNTPQELKDVNGTESHNPNNLVCKAIRAIKAEIPELGIIADVALDPYTINGHDGIVDANGYVDNDLTVEALCKQALVLVQQGCDAVAPSDMMDGRVQEIRKTLESAGYKDAQIISYAAKYNSQFYGPFRDAIGSRAYKADKRSYHMDPANSKEAVLESMLDQIEGADSLIIKPALPYLDIIKTVTDSVSIPTFGYQVSGEYSMLRLGAQQGLFDYEAVMLESIVAIKRAGARGIITYSALEAAKLLQK